MASRKEITDVLEDLVLPAGLAVRTDSSLKSHVKKVADRDDAKKAKKGDYLRRKRELTPLPPSTTRLLRLTPWHVLHDLACALSLARQGAGRGLANTGGA
uniref:hypothetical protein n=1 Tax=Herbidospora sakaeratensis TaxID=564415 RepID=UPI000B293DAF|nr:hypothetical protein [Herbidospora sakaeratensis]